MKRRDFIKLGSLGVAGASVGPLIGLDQNKYKLRSSAPYLKKGFMLGTFPADKEYSLHEKFRMLKNAGFDGVEPESGLDHLEVLEASEMTGLEIPSVVVSTHWDKPLSSPDPKIREEGLEGVKIALRDAHEYGSSCVLLVPGRVTAEVSYDEVYKRSRKQIQKVIPMAEELGVTIAIENVWNHFLLSPLEAARYVDEFKSPNVGWYFDTGNVINYGWAPQWIRILGKRIAMVHVKEYSRKKRDEEGLWKGFEVNYLEGDNNWTEIMRALREVDYSGYGIAEPPYRPDNIQAETWLNDYVSVKLDEIFSMK